MRVRASATISFTDIGSIAFPFNTDTLTQANQFKTIALMYYHSICRTLSIVKYEPGFCLHSINHDGGPRTHCFCYFFESDHCSVTSTVPGKVDRTNRKPRGKCSRLLHTAFISRSKSLFFCCASSSLAA